MDLFGPLLILLIQKQTPLFTFFPEIYIDGECWPVSPLPYATDVFLKIMLKNKRNKNITTLFFHCSSYWVTSLSCSRQETSFNKVSVVSSTEYFKVWLEPLGAFTMSVGNYNNHQQTEKIMFCCDSAFERKRGAWTFIKEKYLVYKSISSQKGKNQ